MPSKAGKRVDGNQAEIVRELRAVGYSVADTHEVGEGFPDIAVGVLGLNFLFEIKDPNSDRWVKNQKRQLIGKEKTFQEEWQGKVLVIESAADAIDFIKETIVLQMLTAKERLKNVRREPITIDTQKEKDRFRAYGSGQRRRPGGSRYGE